jgi:D-alanyl-D-alanine carboxypeptidase
LRQLLNHTAGVYNYTDDEQLVDQYTADPYQEVEIQMIIDRIIEINEAVFEPGTDWAYSNTNYILAGLVIEAATGSTYDAELRSRILDPVGMVHTFLGDVETPAIDVVHGYVSIEGELVDTTEWNVQWTWAAGGLVSTTSDMALFIRALFNGELFADAGSLDQMLDITPSGDNRYGLGIGKMSVYGWDNSDAADNVWGHGGGVPGYLSILMYARDADLVVIELQNGESADPGSVAFDALREVLPFLAEVASEES